MKLGEKFKYLSNIYKDNHFYLRRMAELTHCFMETSPEIPILRALNYYYNFDGHVTC